MDEELNRTNKAIDEGFMSKSETYRNRVQNGKRPSQDIMSPFEDIDPQKYNEVIDGLQDKLKKRESLLDSFIEQELNLNKKITNLQNSRKELKAALLECSNRHWMGTEQDKYRAIANKELDYE